MPRLRLLIIACALVHLQVPANRAQVVQEQPTGEKSADSIAEEHTSWLVDRPYTAFFKRTDVYPPSLGSPVKVTEEELARDSAGRRYTEDRVVSPKEFAGILSARIDDPVARTTTYWSSVNKEASIVHLPPSLPTEDLGARTANARTQDDEANTTCWAWPWQKVEAIGTRTIQGLAAQGQRVTNCVPPSAGRYPEPRIVTIEIWTTIQGNLTVLTIGKDPLGDSYTDEMTDIDFGPPDLTPFKIPADYAVKERFLDAPK